MYWQAEPWGDVRADQREAANTIWRIGAGRDIDMPNLEYPYFKGQDDICEQAKRFERDLRTLSGPEHLAKLRAAKEKYEAEKRLKECL